MSVVPVVRASACTYDEYVYNIYLRDPMLFAATRRPVCGGSNKPQRVQQPVITRHSIVYVHIYIWYMCARVWIQIYIIRVFLRPSVGIKIVQIYRVLYTPGTPLERARAQGRVLNLLRPVQVFGRSAALQTVRVRALCRYIFIRSVQQYCHCNFCDSKFNTENLPPRRRPN